MHILLIANKLLRACCLYIWARAKRWLSYELASLAVALRVSDSLTSLGSLWNLLDEQRRVMMALN